LYFKNINNFSDNYLFIFPECRSDSKILNNYDNNNQQEEEELNLFGNVEIIETSMGLSKNSEDKEQFSGMLLKENTMKDNKVHRSSNDNSYLYINNENKLSQNEELNFKEKIYEENSLRKNIMNISENNLDKENKELLIGTGVGMGTNLKSNNKEKHRLEKTTCKFLINSTIMPDIYELYCKNSNNQIEKYSYASIPDISTSHFIKNIFDGYICDKNEDISTRVKNGNGIYVECTYHKAFKKWIPYKRVDTIDTINTINQIQIILDSL
jgi:hypothetical protein